MVQYKLSKQRTVHFAFRGDGANQLILKRYGLLDWIFSLRCHPRVPDTGMLSIAVSPTREVEMLVVALNGNDPPTRKDDDGSCSRVAVFGPGKSTDSSWEEKLSPLSLASSATCERH